MDRKVKFDREPATSNSLLLQLRDWDDKEAWDEFIRRYAPKILGWCRRYQLQDSDAADVTQDVLRKLVTAMRTFQYNKARGTFRGWLKTVTNNTIRDFLRGVGGRPDRASGDSQMHEHLTAIQSPSALAELAALIEHEAEQELLREAESQVKLRVKPRIWEAYRLTAREAAKAADVAETLEMPVADVYRAKSSVIRMLRQEVERINKNADVLSHD